MKIILRILSGILLISLLSTGLLSCKSQWEKDGEQVIGSCAGYDVLYEELRYVTLSYKDMFESTYGKGIWDTPETAEQYREELEDVVWDMMLNNYTVLAACAYYMDQASINDDSIDDAVDAQVQDTITELGGKKAFQSSGAELNSYPTQRS